jgi:hypothetical protein
VAVKVLKHGVAGEVSNVAVARERMIGLASVHPNVVRHSDATAYMLAAPLQADHAPPRPALLLSLPAMPGGALACRDKRQWQDRLTTTQTYINIKKQETPGLQVAVYAVLTEEPRRRFSIQNPFAAEGSSLKTSIVMELCDR